MLSTTTSSFAPRTGVLLVNLGTPESPGTADVRTYLREFLLDARVIDIPTLQRQLLVNGIIAPFRAPKSAKAYKQLWDAETGSPLKHYTLKLRQMLQDRLGSHFVVRVAMRYQTPSLPLELRAFKRDGIDNLVVIPLFPQYASASTGSVAEAVMREVSKWQIIPTLRIENRYYDRPDFIKAFAKIARHKLAEKDYEFLLFSYHGLPQRQIKKGDEYGICQLGACCNQLDGRNAYCYRAQCFHTTRLLLDALNWPVEKSATTFQSRLGRDPWIPPYTDEFIKELAAKGVKRVAVMSPSFVADCLETISEIGDEYHEIFTKEGGTDFDLVPSLNNTPEWVEVLANMVVR